MCAAQVPDTEGSVVLFGRARALADPTKGPDWVEARVAKIRFDPPEWTRDHAKRLWRDPIDGDKHLVDNRDSNPVVHLRTAGWKTHGADAKHVDIAGRLLTPFYAYVVDMDPGANNYYKRLVRDVVRYGDDLTCAAAAIEAWLSRMERAGPVVPGADATYSSLHARMNDFQFKTSGNVGAEVLRDAVLKSLAPKEALYVATDAKDRKVFDVIRDAGHRVILLEDALHAAVAARRNQTNLPKSWALDANGVPMTNHEAKALARVGRNEYGMLDTLVAAGGRAFTGTWFSTLTTHAQRIRGYMGKPDESTFFSMMTRWAACQKWEEPRRPWYMREFPTAWRDIDGHAQPAPKVGEHVYNGQKDGIDYQQRGYPVDDPSFVDPRTRPFPARPPRRK